MLRRHPIAFAYLFALALWGALALQLRAEPVAAMAASSEMRRFTPRSGALSAGPLDGGPA